MEKEQNQPILHINLLGDPEIRVGDSAPGSPIHVMMSYSDEQNTKWLQCD